MRAAIVGYLPQPLSRMAVVPVAGKTLICGGLQSQRSSSDLLTFDPATKRVRRLGTLPSAVHDTAAASAGSDTLLFGGGGTSESARVELIGADGKVSTRGRMPQPRSDLSVVTVNGVIYVVGGYTGTRDTPDVLATTDGVHFRVVGALPTSVRYAAVVAVGTNIYVVGGDHARRPISAVQRIDTLTGRIEQVGRLPHALGHSSAWMNPNGEVFVAGGTRSDGSTTAEIARLDLATLHLAHVATLPRPASDMAVAQIRGTAYLFGGEGVSRLRTIVAVR